MTKKTIESTYSGKPLQLAWGGDRLTYGDEVLIQAPEGGNYFPGPALRDALIEAFPLPEPDLKVKQYGRVVAEPERLAPGTVWRNSGSTYVTLPGNKVYVTKSGHRKYDRYTGTTIPWSDRRENAGEIVFAPRDAKALPSPLGVRVGDAVRRVQKGDHATVTTEFTVHMVNKQIGYAYPKYGLGHPVDELEVVGREAPDRLPAGTITRSGGCGFLNLVTETGYIALSDGHEYKDDDILQREFKAGHHDVIYLPES